MANPYFKKTEEKEVLNDIFEELESGKEQAVPSEIEPLSEKDREKIKEDVLNEIEGDESQLLKRNLPPTPAATTAAVPILAKSEVLLRIEHVLEQDLGDIYFRLEPAKQQQFKVKGEETAAKIEQVLLKTKFKAKEIFKLIMEWLKVVPGVNHFFIKQEAKIKTDEIIKLRKQS